jgi:3'(2'), 5'-bisphosphate nucleotidase
MPHERELEVALEACQRTLRPILDEYARFEPILDAAADIKLTVDRVSQEILLQHLDTAFPHDSLCAEEDTPTLARVQAAARDPERTWVVDPIDGTRGFAVKSGEFSVMVALVERGRVVVGVVVEPVAQRWTYATHGGGCWRRDGGGPAVPCRVTTTERLADAAVVVSRSSRPGKRSPQLEALAAARTVHTYSAGIKLALVARGEVDLYLNTYPNFHDWDVCAGHVLVDEAGGKVTTLGGAAIVYGQAAAGQRGGLLASNGRVHGAALAALGSGPPSRGQVP